ncbi:hypothetical protein PRZ48_014543 [Zasmidium cellare]|uniref:BTB domain-containing protein n=1 Tax=Zasmidium cellare TaxID=395010 RepID=A0ABR0DZ14_ZASCE|nr:hypothetical protein PRZ48_014543 [Zasmidium cellare]
MSRQANWEKKHFQELINVTEQLRSSVNIYVADEEKPYIVERELLETQSDHFRQLLHDGHENTFRFPDDDLEIWRVFLYWLMEEELPLGLVEPSLDEVIKSIIDCYAMGEKYGLRAFQDYIMEYIFEEMGDWPSIDIGPWWNRRHTVSEAVSYIFRTTQPGSKLRDIFVEEAVVFRLWSDEEPFGVPFSQQQLIDFDGSGFFQMFAQKQAEMSLELPWKAQKEGILDDDDGESRSRSEGESNDYSEDEGRRFDELHNAWSRFDKDRNPVRFWTNYMVDPKKRYKKT